MISVNSENFTMIKSMSLEPKVYVIKVGEKCFIEEKNNPYSCETIYALTDNFGGATFYTEAMFDGIKGLEQKAEMLGGELLQVHLSKRWKEREEDA